MTKVGKYQLVSEIKRGNHITTYRGYDAAAQRFVLVKLATTPLTAESAVFNRLQSEAAIYQQLNHPNIVKLLDTGLEGVYPYLVLEFIDGITLRALIEQAAPFPNDVILCSLAELLEGLAYIHQKGLVHQDIKPENIILDTQGRLRICDFDLALTVPEKGKRGNGISGTVGYFSPEMILGEPITRRSDIFSVGVVAYEMATGARPFQAVSASLETEAIIRRKPIRISAINPAVLEALESLVFAFLEKKSAERPDTGHDALLQLKSTFKLPKAARRHQIIDQFTRAPAIYSDGAVVTTRPAPENGEHPAQKSKRKPSPGLFALLLISIILIAFYWNRWEEPPQTQPLTIQAVEKPKAMPQPFAENSTPPENSPAANGRQATAAPDAPQNGKTIAAAEPALLETLPELPASNPEIVPFDGKNVVIAPVPWANVSLDGKTLGVSTEIGPVFVAAGKHELLFENPRLPRLELAVDIAPGTPDTLRFALLQHFGHIVLKVNPWARVLIDDQATNSPAAVHDLVLSAGEHTLKIVHPSLGTVVRTIRVRAGETQVISINMFDNKDTAGNRPSE